MFFPFYFVYALVGSILPTLVWLFFFLREDRHPEPKRLIFFTFLLGIPGVLGALFFEALVQCATAHIPFENALRGNVSLCMQAPIPFVWWAVIEESIKFLLVALCILWRKAVDEPIDTMIYMLTMALGFSAFETALFLLEPLVRGDFITAITTQNLRFIGAGLLHTLASALVGFSLALTFYKHLFVRFLSLCCGLILAIFLHAEFNRHILQGTGGTMAIVFFFVWIGIVVLFILFEGAKRIHATKTQP